MKKKNITTDDLAVMIHNGFEKTATIEMVEKGFEKVDKRFEQMDRRFDKIEKLILADHKERIEKLEEQMKELRGLLAIK